MKKIFYFAVAACMALVSCSKEVSEVNLYPYGEDGFYIKGYYTNPGNSDTKTTYVFNDGKYAFSWLNADKIAVMAVKKADSSLDAFTFTNSASDGAVATFGAAGNPNFDLGEYAFYPCRYPAEAGTFSYDGKSIYYGTSQTDLAYIKNGTAVANQAEADAATKGTVRLFGTIVEDAAQPMRHIPLIGKKKGETTDYFFKAATGVMKITLKNLPAGANQIRLDADGYALNGYFVFDTNCEIKESYAVDGQKYMNITTSGDAERAFYFPIPTGTIPAGALKVSIMEDATTLYSVTNKQPLTLNRGEVTAVPEITIPSVKVKITGTPTAPKAQFFFSGDVAYVKYGNTMTLDYGPGTTVSTSGTVINLNHAYNYKYPLQYQAYNSSDETVGGLQVLYYYTLTDTGISEVCKQFTSATTDIGLSAGTPSLTNNEPFSATTPTITFEASDNTLLGNIMVTEFCGVSGKAYGSYVDYQTASGTPAQGLPQIVINNDVFCTAGGKDYVLKEAYYDGARFAVKTTNYGTPSVYGVNADLACWGGVVGLYSDSWGPYVQYFFDPE